MDEHIFYRPPTGVAADVIPYFANDAFYLYYLRDERDAAAFGEGTPWCLLTTKDFVRFEEHGVVLPNGTREDRDLYAFTGSVAELGGAYYIYYTGHNPHLMAQGKPQEVILRARSEDLIHWEKDERFSLYAPSGDFEADNWRDPYVWRDAEDGQCHMLLMARRAQGAPRRRGVTAHLVSPDGESWTLAKEPFYAPSRFNAHECPDYFQMGAWQYLLFSEYSQEKVTRYVMRPVGLSAWQQPADDRIDATAFYAAKTAADSCGRYAFGWIPTREGNCDQGAWQWGGCLCVHEAIPRANGTLGLRMPPSVRGAFGALLWRGQARFGGAGGRESRRLGELPCVCLVDVRLAMDEAREIELAFRASAKTEEGVSLRLDFAGGRAAMDTWPREPSKAFEPGLERPLPSPNADGSFRVQLLLDGTAGCAYLQEDTALCFRCYAGGGDELIVSAVGAKGIASIEVRRMAAAHEENSPEV